MNEKAFADFYNQLLAMDEDELHECVMAMADETMKKQRELKVRKQKDLKLRIKKERVM